MVSAGQRTREIKGILEANAMLQGELVFSGSKGVAFLFADHQYRRSFILLVASHALPEGYKGVWSSLGSVSIHIQWLFLFILFILFFEALHFVLPLFAYFTLRSCPFIVTYRSAPFSPTHLPFVHTPAPLFSSVKNPTHLSQPETQVKDPSFSNAFTRNTSPHRLPKGPPSEPAILQSRTALIHTSSGSSPFQRTSLRFTHLWTLPKFRHPDLAVLTCFLITYTAFVYRLIAQVG